MLKCAVCTVVAVYEGMFLDVVCKPRRAFVCSELSGCECCAGIGRERFFCDLQLGYAHTCLWANFTFS